MNVVDLAESRSAVGELFAAMRRGETRALARAVSIVEEGREQGIKGREQGRATPAAKDRPPGTPSGNREQGRATSDSPRGMTERKARATAGDSAPSQAEELLILCRGVLAGRTRAVRIGITGPAGAGKSTLVDALTRELRRQDRRVGIVAVDPSSPFSGGAILGDRIRLGELAGDAGVYMRSMATRGHLGGLARATEDVLTVIEAAWVRNESGNDSRGNVLLIETTGVGQGEIEVVGLADLVAVVLVPGMGDAIQSLKAGVLEIASVFVLNKADRDGMERLEAEIGEMVGLSHAISTEERVPQVMKTVATSGQGVAELLEILDSLAVEGERTSGAKARTDLMGVSGTTEVVPTQNPTEFVPFHEANLSPDLGAVLDHLGIAVRSIALSQRLYEALGIPVSAVEEVAQERVRVAMLTVGESRMELLESMDPVATNADSAVGRFIARRGEGLHHIALRVGDLAGTVAKLKQQDVRLVSETIQVGAGGHRYVFVHPSSANGVLLELVEDAHSAERRSGH